MATAPQTASLSVFYKDLIPLNSCDYSSRRNRKTDRADWLANQYGVPLAVSPFSAKSGSDGGVGDLAGGDGRLEFGPLTLFHEVENSALGGKGPSTVRGRERLAVLGDGLAVGVVGPRSTTAGLRIPDSSWREQSRHRVYSGAP